MQDTKSQHKFKIVTGGVTTPKHKFKIVTGGVTTPKGFRANGVHCGIKASKKRDLALIYSIAPAVAAGAFTTNRFTSSSVKVSKEHLNSSFAQAIIVNSGNANCGIGIVGYKDAELMAELTGGALGTSSRAVLVASTGVIGERLPIGKIREAIRGLIRGLGRGKRGLFADAIMTTDTKKKESCVRMRLAQRKVAIGAATKGAGMIYPNLKVKRQATTLTFITTDASITKELLERALDEAVNQSFNMISVDGDMSTNDMVLIIANGLAGNKMVYEDGPDFERFKEGLNYVTRDLAKKIVKDGEGATKFIEVRVRGARTVSRAKVVARKISTSNLVKTCVYGNDPNWGRVMAAAGASGVDFSPDKVDIYLGKAKVLSNGIRARRIDKRKLEGIFKKDLISVTVDLKSGPERATAWTCDLSKKYVEINSEYMT